MRKTFTLFLFFLLLSFYGNAQKQLILCTTGRGLDNSTSVGIDSEMWAYIQKWVNLTSNGQDAGVTAVRLHIEWKQYEPTLGNYQGAKLVAALQAIKNLKPNMKLALHFSYLRSGSSGDSYLADEDIAKLADGSLMKDPIAHTVPSVYSATARTRFINMVHNAMTAVSSFYNDILYVQMGNSEAEEFIIPIQHKNGYHHSGYYEDKALASWRTEYLPCRYPSQDSVTWQGNKYKIADAPPYDPGEYGDYNGEHGREYHRFASWGLMRLHKQFRDAVKSHNSNLKVLYFIPGFGTAQANIRSLHSASIPAAYNEFDGIYCSEGTHTGDTWRKIMVLDVLKATNPNKIAAVEFDPIDLGQGQGGLWPNMVTEWFARAYKHGADYIHFAMHFYDPEIDQLAPAIAGIKSTYITPNYQPPARQNPVSKNIYPSVFTGASLFDDLYRTQLQGDNWSTTDNSPKSISMSDAGYWENINSCTPVNTCDYNISASGPTNSVGVNTSITLNSTISGQSSGVSYSWSGTGINGSNTGSTVTFNTPSTAGTYTYTLTTSKSGCSNKTATVSVTVTTSGGGGSGAYTQEFDNFFNARLNSSYNGQVTAIVGCGDNILYTYNRGFTLDQKLNIMSLTKWTTAAIIMMLEKENKLKLTDTIGKHLPIFTQYGKGDITIEQLLAHTSGLPIDTEYDERSDMNLKTAVENIAMHTGRPWAGQFKYGSTSYKIAARIAEVVSGTNGIDKPFKEIFAERLASVSGMPNARYRYQIPYSEDNPAGGYGLEVSSYEYANFLKMILRYGWFNGTRVMDSTSVVEIEKKHNIFGQFENYGLGVQRDNYPNSNQLRQAWHEGASGTFAFLNREKKYYALVFGQNGGPASLASRDFKDLVDQLLDANSCGTVNPQPCEYGISVTGPTENVGTGTPVTLTSNCTGPCSGVSYLWSGTGISGSNTGTSVTFNAPSTAGTYTYTLTTSKSGCTNQTKTFQVNVGSTSGGGGCVVNKVRLQFRATGDCCMDRLPGAKIQGSNNGTSWTDLHTFTTNGTGSWQEITLSNTTAYSSVRFVASNTGWGELHELEFYNGTTKLSGTAFGTDNYSLAFDGNTSTQWHAPTTPGPNNYAGLNLTGCPGPTNCDFNVTASATSTSVYTLDPITLNFNCTGADCSGTTFAWSGQGISGNQSPKSITAPATAGNYTYTITATKSGCTTKSANVNVTVNPTSGGTGCVVNKVRFQFRATGDCCMDRLPGAKIQGSNNGTSWTDLHTFNANGTGSWQEVTLSNTTAYSSVRFVASNTGWGELHELEFYNGTTKLSGTAFGTDNYSLAFDGNTSTQWHAPTTPGPNNYAGLNLTGCSAPTNCNFNMSASATNTTVNTLGTITLNYNCTGADCGGATFAWSGQGISGNQSPKTITAPATAGTYTYTITATKSGCTSANANVVVNVTSGTFSQCLESETSNGNGTVTTDANASNGSTRGEENNNNHYVDYAVTGVPVAGTYYVTLRYYSSSAPTVSVKVNSQTAQNYSLANSGSWNIVSTTHQFTVSLLAGNNTIRIAGVSGGSCRQDRICVSHNSGSSVVLEPETDGISAYKKLFVTPNPSKGIFDANFYLEMGKKATIVVTDIQGRTIIRQSVTGNGAHRQRLNLGNKSSGIFILQLISDKNIEVMKVNVLR